MRSFLIKRLPKIVWVFGVLTILSQVLVTSASAQTPPKVAVTIKPVHSLVAQVMGETGKPALIVDGATSPHTYGLRPSDAKVLNAANIVFRMSEALEPFTAKIAKSLPASVRVVSLDQGAGIKRLARRSGGTFEMHAAAGAKDAHGHGHGSSLTSASDADGHVWLDPRNAVTMIDEISGVLSSTDPARAQIYKINADKAKDAIHALDAEIERDLKPLADRPYVVFHDAYQYFEVRFGLSPVGSITTNPEVPPSGKRLADIRRKLGALSASCVFSEPGFSTRVVQAVTEGTSAKSGVLDPEGTTLPAGPDLYGALMRKLAAGFKSCLGSAG
jgi:zinc transport system substrate-binding protein